MQMKNYFQLLISWTRKKANISVLQDDKGCWLWSFLKTVSIALTRPAAYSPQYSASGTWGQSALIEIEKMSNSDKD